MESIPERGGWPIIKEYVQRKKVDTDFDAHKLISVAERFGFSVESKWSILRVSRGTRFVRYDAALLLYQKFDFQFTGSVRKGHSRSFDKDEIRTPFYGA